MLNNKEIALILVGLNLKGANFVSLKKYESKKTGEIANFLINTNISVENAKKADLETLKSVSIKELTLLSKTKEMPLDVLKTALSEMIQSSEKNLNPDLKKRSKNSQAQTDAFIKLNKAIKINKTSGEVHIFGMRQNKEVIVKGVYNTVNSRPKTIAKKMITKHFNLRADNFRTFIVNNIETVNMNKQTLNFGF